MTSLLNSIKNLAKQTGEDTKTRFSVAPGPGDSGFTQWQNGMRMVARLPEGIPSQFRKTLWLNLAEKHLASRGVQWSQVEEFCFNEFTNPDDDELGVQIVKDVHRTGCSLFCGVSGKDNQALLKRVLLAYARWNKAVGYCQGFNMLAALILQVMDKSEVDSVKVMIYLIEGVLPESYFANNLRGLSVDMAVFRDLLRIKLPTLSRHFDQLQSDSKDSGTSYEPPLTNVFTMQWFLTLFCNCLPQDTVLRVWDLIFLEGNHILLSTALAIWSTLSDRIMTVESADEFYSIMGVLTREMLEFGLMDANALIKAIVSFNLPELPELREKYLYNITPWTQSVSTVARRGLRLFYSDDDTDTEEDDEKIAIATAYGLFRSPKRKEGTSGVTSPPRTVSCPDKEKIAMDISALTKQYRKLRERQKQAHVILTAACGSQSLVGPTTTPAMNHLLMGKFALVNNKGRRLGPPPGSIPPPSQPRPRPGEKSNITISGETLHWKDADGKKVQQKEDDEEATPEPSSRRSSSSSTSTELCDDPQRSPSDSEDLSDASAFLPSDTEPSTPKRSVQPKVQHPLDVISCKEEDEESIEKPEEKNTSHLAELDVKQKSSNSLSPASPEGDEDKSPKRKLSFRIDPEELRQLDRKLSLKIVEIERRKSSAGIESEDLNSKVLFPFDRDYIQELEKCDRDTPSSIPDDRMCSTEDYLSGFEEETILVPDIITTHKPLGYRMASVEECDETKVNDSYEESEIPEGLTRGGDIDDERLYMENESTEEQYDGEDDEDEEVQNAYSSFNFDELFIKKDSENSKDGLEVRENFDDFNCCERSIKSENNPNQNGLPIISPISTSNPQEIISSSYSLPGTSDGTNSEKYNESLSFQTSPHMSDDMKVNIAVKEKTKDNCFFSVEKYFKSSNGESGESNMELDQIKPTETCSTKKDGLLDLSQAEEGVTQGISSVTFSNMSDSEKALEKKLYSILPKIASLSMDSGMPDVAAVASRDACINSIREKYANLGQKSRDENDSNLSESLNISKTETDTTDLTGNPTMSFIEVKTSDDISLLPSSMTNQNIKDSFMSQIHKTSETIGIQEEILKPNLVETAVESNVIYNTNDNPSEQINKNTINEEESNSKSGNNDEVIRRPSSASSNRRGSEVLLSLILKENSQILSKIQQQSRRSSEVNFDQTSTHEKLFKTESPEENVEKRLKTDEEIISLTKAILESEADLSRISELDTNKYETVDEFSLMHVGTISTPKKRDYDASEQQKVTNSTELLTNNKTQAHQESDKNKEKTNERQEVLKESNLNEICESNDNQSLPDVCKFNLNTSPKHKNIISSIDQLQQYSPLKSTKDIRQNTEEPDNLGKNYKDPYNYSKRPSIMSPTTELDENSPPETNSLLKFKLSSIIDEPVCSSHKSIAQPCKFSATPTLNENLDSLTVERNFTDAESLSDTNEDILKELRLLNIKPEEVLEYSDPKAIPITPLTPEDSFPIHSEKSPFGSSLNLASSKEKSDHNKLSSELTSEFRTPRHCFQDYKTSSFDVVSSTKSELYTEERRKPIMRAATAVDDDNSLYLSSYKSHGRLLIEKGELDPYRNLDKETNKLDTTRYSDNKLLNTDEESAYDYRRVNNSRVNRSYSEFLADDTRSSDPSKSDPKEKMLFKYKSEDYGRSMSPPHYRFSSASPVRRRLDTLPTDSPTSPYSSIARAKSPSPTYYSSSHSISSRESGSIGSPERLGTDSPNKSSTEYKRYSRTESLDLNRFEVRSSYSKKRAESFDTTTSGKTYVDKKSPVSPQKFNPFPVRSSSRQPKELGVKLGLYLPPKSDKSPSKHLT